MSFTGERLLARRAFRLRPDVSICMPKKADRQGNVLVQGIYRRCKREACWQPRACIVTVEEIVDDTFGVGPMALVIPGWAVTLPLAVAERGAHPS